MTDVGRGQLVEAIGAMHHPSPFDSQQTEHARDRLDPFFAKHANDLIFGSGRIGERPKQIEKGADAELIPHFCDMAHGGVMYWGKHEADPAGRDAARNRLGRAFNIDAEGR